MDVAEALASWRSGENEAFTRFMVLADSRTGSTWLMDLLRSHPNVVAYDEVFHGVSVYGSRESGVASSEVGPVGRREADPASFLEQAVFAPKDGSTGAVGFKVFYRHLIRRSHRLRLPRALKSATGLRVVSLARRDMLAMLVSRTLAWGQQAGQDRVRISPAHCLAFFVAYDGQRHFWERYFGGHPLIRVDYEDLVAQPGPSLAPVLEHLGLEPHELRSEITRAERDPPTRTVLNYSELRSFFRRTRWSHLFSHEEVS